MSIKEQIIYRAFQQVNGFKSSSNEVAELPTLSTIRKCRQVVKKLYSKTLKPRK